MADVFISYCEADQGTAAELARDLKLHGFDVWWDIELYAGHEFHRLIRSEIKKARAVVVIWSDAAANSACVRGEAEEAADDHSRRFGRNQTAYDPRHYVPQVARKPGALRNGAPFKDWPLPGAIACGADYRATDDAWPRPALRHEDWRASVHDSRPPARPADATENPESHIPALPPSLGRQARRAASALNRRQSALYAARYRRDVARAACPTADGCGPSASQTMTEAL